MPRTLFVVDRILARFRIGNIAVAAVVLLMPLVLAIGFLTDRETLPGHGISARAGLQAALDLPTRKPRG
jgi:hypothetical protein